jgi:thioredoxin-related protein
VAKEFADKGFLVLAVDAGESKKTVKQYLAKSPRAVPIVLMENTNLAAMFSATSYPLYVLVDADGKIAGELRGARGERALRNLLRKAGLD